MKTLTSNNTQSSKNPDRRRNILEEWNLYGQQSTLTWHRLIIHLPTASPEQGCRKYLRINILLDLGFLCPFLDRQREIVLLNYLCSSYETQNVSSTERKSFLK